MSETNIPNHDQHEFGHLRHKAENVTYPDGSVNVELKEPGTTLKLGLGTDRSQNLFDLRTSPTNVIDVTLRDANGIRYDYVYTECGLGPMVRLISNESQKKTQYELVHDLPDDYVDQLYEESITVGAYSDFFGEQMKVEKVSAIAAVKSGATPTAERANPITLATRIINERAQRKG